MGCKLINLEEGWPTVNEGLLRLERALTDARATGLPVLKLIHGYGSTGEGGRMKPEVWKVLDRYKRNGMIEDFIPGEEFRLSHEATWELLKREKSLKQDADLGRGNRGITIVVL